MKKRGTIYTLIAEVDYNDDDPDIFFTLKINDNNVHSIINFNAHDFDIKKWKEFCNDVIHHKACEYTITHTDNIAHIHGFISRKYKLMYAVAPWSTDDYISVSVTMPHNDMLNNVLEKIGILYEKHINNENKVIKYKEEFVFKCIDDSYIDIMFGSIDLIGKNCISFAYVNKKIYEDILNKYKIGNDDNRYIYIKKTINDDLFVDKNTLTEIQYGLSHIYELMNIKCHGVCDTMEQFDKVWRRMIKYENQFQ